MLNRRVIVSVTNDLTHDQRVHKVCSVLLSYGYQVTLAGRMLKNSKPLKRDYKTVRFRLPFNKGMLFYACYNIRLFFYLVGSRAEVFHANDLDTLPANYLASLFCRSRVVYDSHEYFTEVPELAGRPFARGVWKWLETMIFPKLKHVITVNDSIASFYADQYKTSVKVMRNVPYLKDTLRLEAEKKSRRDLSLPEDKKIIILQGAWINIDRGGEEAVRMMKFLPDCFLLIVGGGDVFEDLKELALQESVEKRIRFFNRLSFDDLRQLTMNADLGISLDKGTNLNYLYSLPNKLFDYIHAGTPVLVSSMPEVAAVVRSYEVGEVIETHDPERIAASITSILHDEHKMYVYGQNCLSARKELCWEHESGVLKEFY